MTLLVTSACVSHHTRVKIPEVPETALSKAIFQDGTLIDANQAMASSPQPLEMYVDAWYRDQDGKLHRAQSHVKTPRPWWQRFPADFFTDGLWPGQLEIEQSGKLQFRKCESLTTSYLDQVAAAYGF